MSIQAMIISIRNNNLMRSERVKFKRSTGIGYAEKPNYNFPKATNKQLKSIRKQLRRQHINRMVKVILLTIIIFLGLLVVVSSLLN